MVVSEFLNCFLGIISNDDDYDGKTISAGWLFEKKLQ